MMLLWNGEGGDRVPWAMAKRSDEFLHLLARGFARGAQLRGQFQQGMARAGQVLRQLRIDDEGALGFRDNRDWQRIRMEALPNEARPGNLPPAPNRTNVPPHIVQQREAILRARAMQDAIRDIQQQAIRDGDPVPGIHQPGPHAVEGIPIQRGQNYRTPAIQAQNNVNGNRHGCHICGSRDPGNPNGNWVRDRIPSERIAGEDVAVQWVFPSCARCSADQGFLVAFSRWLRSFLELHGQ